MIFAAAPTVNAVTSPTSTSVPLHLEGQVTPTADRTHVFVVFARVEDVSGPGAPKGVYFHPMAYNPATGVFSLDVPVSDLQLRLPPGTYQWRALVLGRATGVGPQEGDPEIISGPSATFTIN